MEFSSKLLEKTIDVFASLPGIGRKSALRLALHLLKIDTDSVQEFTTAITNMKTHIRSCQRCHNISDNPVCHICEDARRDKSLICVVENIKDVMAIESTAQYKGLYHILGGIISPIEGVGPSDLTIDSLLQRIQEQEVKEIIMAISPTIEGDTTIFYISKKIKNLPIKVSTLARGISFGGELQYADELTLGRSIVTRIPYKSE